MESINDINTDAKNKVISLQNYKEKKQGEKSIELFAGLFYEHEELPLYINLLSISLPNPFSDLKLYTAVSSKQELMVFQEGEEKYWVEITEEYFIQKVNESKDDETEV